MVETSQLIKPKKIAMQIIIKIKFFSGIFLDSDSFVFLLKTISSNICTTVKKASIKPPILTSFLQAL
jgi:hypothetical protein